MRGQKLLALGRCRVGLSALACVMAGALNDTRRVGTVDAEVDQCDGSSGARGSTVGTGVWVRIGRVPIVLAMPRLGEACPGTGQG
jgi:hypothetical protein